MSASKPPVARNPSDQLARDGYAVIPVLDPTDTDDWCARLKAAVQTGPENTDEARNESALLVGGGFGALGHPSSFHSPVVRELRALLFAAVIARKAIPVPVGHGLSMVFDRVGYRLPGLAPTSEAWHRDQPGKLHSPLRPGEALYGGWFSMTEGQEFWCAPGTHRDPVGTHGGFNTKVTPAELAEAKAKRTCVKVPKGSLLIFNENLLHEVVSKRSTSLMVRLFTGWYVSAPGRTEPRIPDTATVIEEQAVPTLKSGQTPPMVPAMYVNQLRTNQGRIASINKCYRQAACSKQQIGAKAKYQGPTGDGTFTAPYRARARRRAAKTVQKPRVMLSLREMAKLDPTIKLHPPYTPAEKKLFYPHPNPYAQ